MFWRFGGYASVSTIDTILEKDNFSLEDLLDESDLIQELKSHNAKLIEYLREDKVLEKLLDYVVAPKLAPVAAPIKDEEKVKSLSLSRSRSRSSSRAGDPIDDEADQEKKRNRYAYIAAEILASDNWSINEALMESKPLLRNFWHFLKRPVPLDPLQASYFTKVNESLFDKKTEDMLGLLKTLDGAVADMLKHVDCPMIMDLLLRIISLERQPVGQGVVEWLYTQDLMPTLLSFLGPEHNWATQTSAGDFMKAIITVSANASQNEQTCIGPNELTRQLVSKPCVEQLIKYMLGGGNALTCGVGIIIEVIRKNNSDYDPDGLETGSIPSSRDPIYLGTLLRLFAQHVPDFMNLIMNRPAQRERHVSTFGAKIEPLGFDRFKTCELMAELLHCSNMGLLNDVGSEEFIAARDAQRNKLRAEGRLLSTRGEEAQSSPEDLEMRVSHSSPVAETRKLEVTNTSVDDDGFEEVSHTGDDENSHGVEELPDLLSQAASEDALATLLNTDDDFVDEPLSSPRLIVRELEGKHDEEQVPSEKPHDEKLEQAAGTGENPVPDPMDTDDIPFQPTQHISSPEPPNKKMADLVVSSPHDSAAELDAAPSTEKSSEDQPAVAKDAEVTVAPDTTQGESGEVSINVNHISRPTTPIDDSPVNSRPVVGDYLKLQFVEHGVVPSILGFFFSYPWNNFLHNVVYDIVQQVFNGPMDRGQNPALAMSLFEAADITNQIINGQLASEKSQAETKTRMGYMGHLTLIAEEVVKFTERHPAEILSEVVLEKVMAQDWINYVEGALAETRERDNAILGGVRPEVAMSNRAGASGLAASGISGLGSIGLGVNSSSALADAGLNGSHELSENTGVIGPFAISAGTLMSGFGSSSDEDDDEEQENEEDVNNEVGRSIFSTLTPLAPFGRRNSQGPSGSSVSSKRGSLINEDAPKVEYCEDINEEEEEDDDKEDNSDDYDGFSFEELAEALATLEEPVTSQQAQGADRDKTAP
ncbi:SIT4 phosphatase-associated protein-domain-containing protein [Podospora didyma]|uniref:SIT4 phosphatase-associated protein-domain-containing protein n=1 Tax=Podospora didyma TaxID=330526 RepID=A0AAE0U084_9PEZI|nr:SIT4 phosphatase-associated protein-domain-containing protein [Podospora didyma]